jgi:hypothetical protein
MAKPRSQQISLLDTQYYHICSRTVRKEDKHSMSQRKDTGLNTNPWSKFLTTTHIPLSKCSVQM